MYENIVIFAYKDCILFELVNIYIVRYNLLCVMYGNEEMLVLVFLYDKIKGRFLLFKFSFENF